MRLRFSSGDLRRLGVLTGLWLASATTYYFLLLRPYGLLIHLSTPRLSLGVLSQRQPSAAASFLMCAALTFLFYALAYRICRHWRSAPAAAACVVMGVLTALLLAFVYPIGATDVFDYMVQGELLALRNLNPLAVPAAAVADLPLLRYASYARAVSPYGPLWVLLQASIVKIASPGGLTAVILGFKALAILGYLSALALIAGLLLRAAPQRLVAGLVAFAWNPLVLTEVAVNAHNDIWIGTLLLAGVLCWQIRRPLLMLVSLTLGLLVKPFTAPLVPLFALSAWRMERPGARARLLIGGAVIVAALFASPYLLLPQGVQGMGALLQRTELYTHSLPAVVYLALSFFIPKHEAEVLVGLATTAVFGAYVLLQLRNAWRQPQEVVRLAFNIMLFLLLLCMPWFQPWYLVTLMALAAVYPRPNAPFQAALSTACVVVSYVIFGFVWFWWTPLHNNFLWVNLLAVLTTYAVPWAYAVWSGLRGWHRPAGEQRAPA